MDLIRLIQPELILIGAACVLFLLGISSSAVVRRTIVPGLALLTLLGAIVVEVLYNPASAVETDSFNTFRISQFTHYIRILTAAVSVLFVLMFWPSDRAGTGNSALEFGADAGEFFALLLLAIAGVFLVAGADDMILLFLGIELASIPTYVMVSISRRQPVAQEAGVKYFFLGAMAAALMLFGFSYLYGTTGTTSLRAVAQMLSTTMTTGMVQLTAWQMLAVLMLIAGFSFKIAAVPLHVYAADVYQGAATPVTAMLSFIPKTSGMVALIKLLMVAGGGVFAVPDTIARLMWILAVLTMTVGNVLGLLQFNVKRVLAYSSIAHSGYMLVGLTALVYANQPNRPGLPGDVERLALIGVLFYLAAYGVMNAAAFGVLMLLPARPSELARECNRESSLASYPVGSAETFEDLAGQGRNFPLLGLAMAVSCFSLIGLPLTVGFFGKLYLILPALRVGGWWLVVITLVNAAISAAYYLRIVGTMFLRAEARSTILGTDLERTGLDGAARPFRSVPVSIAISLSVFGTLLLGMVLPATQELTNAANAAASVDDVMVAPANESADQAAAHSAP